MTSELFHHTLSGHTLGDRADKQAHHTTKQSNSVCVCVCVCGHEKKGIIYGSQQETESPAVIDASRCLFSAERKDSLVSEVEAFL